tara:strand:+ start:153 stop:365 length:213 start_codon:yes stop_codon:yes gene_type:complete
MNKSVVKLDTLRQLEELVQSRIEKLGPVMDDYDGGQKAAYENVLTDIRAFRAIIKHTSSYSGQQDPGLDF